MMNLSPHPLKKFAASNARAAVSQSSSFRTAAAAAACPVAWQPI